MTLNPLGNHGATQDGFEIVEVDMNLRGPVI